MKSLPLLGGWPEVLSQAEVARRQSEDRRLLPVKIDLAKAAGGIMRVETVQSAQHLLATLKSTSLSAIALDSEYSFDRPEIELRSGKTWTDIRSQRPICVSLAAWVSGDQPAEKYVLRAVLDVRRPETIEALKEILRLRVPFIFHHVKVELFTFWSLGLDPDFHQIYDTYLVAACLHLGRHHPRSQDVSAADDEDPEEIQAKADLARAKAHWLSLVGQCGHYGLGYPFSESKEELREAFLKAGTGKRLSDGMLEYASADAEWTLRLYVAQQPDIIQEGVDHHLRTVEFPFAAANARMEWHGVHVDPQKREKLREATRKATEHYAGVLRAYGIDPPGSRDKFLELMAQARLSQHFLRDGKLTTKKEVLEELEALHPAIRPFRLHRRYSCLSGEVWVHGGLVGANGRMHPKHNQLGADTGRNSCSAPNLAGIGRILRPVVTAPPGRGLIELDFSQIEVGVVAAEHDDPDLVAAFNSGDVYAAMAQRFYADRLSPGEKSLAPRELKKRQPELRNRMKTFVLAVLYNIQALGIASRFGIGLREAEGERTRFLNMYPVVKRRLEESSHYGALCGYSAVVSGLRRKTEKTGRQSFWAKNFLRNTPIQGSAAVVFKTALIRLDQAFRGTDTWLVLPVHDAVLLECQASRIDEVAATAATIMEEAMHAVYPQLEPRVDVNKAHPECWNKDGRADSLERFLEDPTFRIDVALREAAPPQLEEGAGA